MTESDWLAERFQFSQEPDGRLERHRLKGKTFTVEVVLKASNSPHVRRSYVLTNLAVAVLSG